MARTRNEQALAETAEVLLREIKDRAPKATTASVLKELAEAFALVASRDPELPPPSPQM